MVGSGTEAAPPELLQRSLGCLYGPQGAVQNFQFKEAHMLTTAIFIAIAILLLVILWMITRRK